MEEENQAGRSCLNCGSPVTSHFCADCGQTTRDLRLSLWGLFREFTEEFFSVDSKLVKTLVPLFFRPGHLTRSFIEGKRICYLRPVKMYLFFSVLFFLTLSLTKPDFEKIAKDGNLNITGNISEDDDYKETLAEIREQGGISEETIAKLEEQITNGRFQEDLPDTQASETGDSDPGAETTPAQPEAKPEPEAAVRTPVKPEKKSASLMEKFEAYAKGQEDKFGKMEPAEVLKRFYPVFMGYISWALFLLMPIFAFILKLLYVRRDPLYLDHLIFAFHYHSFLFLFFSVLALGTLVPTDLETVNTVLMSLVMPIYLFMSMRRVYEQSRFKTFCKLVLLAMLYSFSLLLATLFSLLVTFLLA